MIRDWRRLSQSALSWRQTDQSEASIQVTWPVLTNQRPAFWRRRRPGHCLCWSEHFIIQITDSLSLSWDHSITLRTQGVNNNKRTTCRRGQEKLHQVRRKLDFLFNTDIVISTVELWTIGQYNRKRNRILRPVSGQCCLHYPGFTRHYRQSLLNRDNEDKDV